MRAAAPLSRGAPKSAPAEQNRVLSGEAGRWLGVAAGTAVERADSHPPTMSAMHTAAAWLHYKGASAAAHGPPAIPAAASCARAIFYKFIFYGAASTGTLLWHLEHFAE